MVHVAGSVGRDLSVSKVYATMLSQCAHRCIVEVEAMSRFWHYDVVRSLISLPTRSAASCPPPDELVFMAHCEQ